MGGYLAANIRKTLRGNAEKLAAEKQPSSRGLSGETWCQQQLQESSSRILCPLVFPKTTQ